MSMKCLTNGLEVNYPCSPACALFGDCVTAFEANKKASVSTNADHIRSMTDEELAVALKIIAKYDVCFNTQCEKCGDCIFYPFCNSVRCAEDVAEWLKQPYKEDA